MKSLDGDKRFHNLRLFVDMKGNETSWMGERAVMTIIL